MKLVKYKQIYFYPLMFFDGYHMNEDIKKEVEFQKNQNKIDIKLFEKFPYGRFGKCIY